MFICKLLSYNILNLPGENKTHDDLGIVDRDKKMNLLITSVQWL